MTGIPYDGYAPHMSVSIRAQDGSVYPLWMDPTFGPGRADRPFVEEVTVKLGLSAIPILTAKLSPTYLAGIDFLDSTLIEYANNGALEVRIGYVPPNGRAILSPIYEGLLLKPGVDIGADVGITLNAQGIPVGNATAGGATVQRRGSRRDIVDLLMRGPDPANPARMRLDTSEVEALGARHETYRLFFSTPLDIPQSGRTDWQMLQQLVWESKCWPVILGETDGGMAVLKILPRAIMAERGPTRTLRFFNHPPAGYGSGREYPLISGSSPSIQDYLRDDIGRGYRQTGVDRLTRLPTSEVTTDATAAPARRGPMAQTVEPSPISPGVGPGGRWGYAALSGDPKDPTAVARARAQFDHGTTAAGIKLNVQAYGIPDLHPGEIVFVTGFGRRLVCETGYIVMNLTHTVGGGGFTTDLELVSNTASALENAQRSFGPSAQPAPSGASTSTGAETQTPTQSPPARAGARGRGR